MTPNKFINRLVVVFLVPLWSNVGLLSPRHERRGSMNTDTSQSIYAIQTP